MAMPIPALTSQYLAGSTDTATVTSGTLQTLASTHWYFLVSPLVSVANGQSLLYAIRLILATSLAGTAWSLGLFKSGSVYKVGISHNNGSSRTITWGAALQSALGFASSTTVVATATTVLSDYPSPLFWTPDQVVSMTGPVLFDPSINFGVPSSVGAAQRSSDMTAAYVENGIQYEAEYVFNGVQYYYKIRPQAGFVNQDLETWWSAGPRKGRRILFWRDRTNVTTALGIPTQGVASPYNYIEYNPQPDLRGTFPAVPMAPPKLTFWDVTLKFWVTENGEFPAYNDL
jgi:hypothetical protein